MSNITKPDPLFIATGLIFVVPLAAAVFAFIVAKAQMMANEAWNQRKKAKS